MDDNNSWVSIIQNAVRIAASAVIKKYAGIIAAIILAILLLFMTILVALGATSSFTDGGNDVYEQNGIGVAQAGDPEYEEWWYDPQNVLDNLDDITTAIDPNAEGYMYIDQDNMRSILERIITYRDDEHTMRAVSNTYKYYYHYYHVEVSYQYETDDETGEETVHTEYRVTDIEDKEKTSVVLNATIESDSLFAVSWEEIYAMASMKSLMVGVEGEWKDEIATTPTTPTQITTVTRLDEATIDRIISSFTYNFEYNFDPTLPPYSSGYIFEYDEMENYAYIEVPQGTNVEHGTEVTGETPSFEYRKMKIPAIAPAYGVNCYELVEYAYAQDGTLEGRWITIDGTEFYNFAKEIIGQDFDMEWFLEMLKQLPGVNYDSGAGSLLDKYEKIYESYISGQPVTYFENNIPGAGSIRLGSGCTQKVYDPSLNQGLFSNNSSYNRTGKAYEPIESANAIIQEAQKYIGNPYVYGGTSLTNGIDCSAFVQQIYAMFGISLPRTSAAQAAVCQRVSISEAQPGDLLFRTENGSASGVRHVAILIGIENGEYITVEAMGSQWGICIGRRPISRSDLFVGRVPQ